jgi:disulfide bond formation protein DsbB
VGLGDRVKLPLLHGGATWVNLMLFMAMGIAGVIFLATRNERIYAWEVGFRTIACPMWLVSSVLGFIAASSTWDFTGSKESRLTIIASDPRLMAQILLLAGVAIVLVADSVVLDKRWHKAALDVVFTAIGTVIMADIFLDPVKRALHPDSPVLNSGWEIKAPFFGMVAAVFAIGIVLSWVASTFVSAPAEVAVQVAPQPSDA